MISVCIATYNGEKYICQQIASIISQIGEEDEVIVSDDGSTDSTLDIIRSFGDKRIKIITGPKQHSPILNFQHALQAAQGEYIFLADQDDVWKPQKVETCMAWLEQYCCVVSDAEVTDNRLQLLHPSLFALMKIKPGRLYNMVWRNGYTGCCMAFRRCVLTASLPFPENIPMHDIWIGNVAAYRYNVKFIGDRLIFFRRHNKSLSCNGKGSRFSLWQKIMFRVNTIQNIIRRL